MLYKFQQRIKPWWFKIWCGQILSTPPIQTKEGRVWIVSMVSHSDLTMYLVAVKSLYSHLGEGQIVVLNDGTLTSADIEVLYKHLSNPQIITADDVKSDKCPRGGCWERLLSIAKYVGERYIVQLDSDTLTLSGIPEVVSAIKENCSFTLGTSMGRYISPMRNVFQQMKDIKSDHVQVIAEQNFNKLRDYAQLKYVRGSAGFAGFAQGAFPRSKVEEFSLEMEDIVGKVWASWGSEQVASNFLVANSPRAHVLPYPKYSNYTLDTLCEKNAFLHFIGTYRFRKGVYIGKAQDTIKKLKIAGSERISEFH